MLSILFALATAALVGAAVSIRLWMPTDMDEVRGLLGHGGQN